MTRYAPWRCVMAAWRIFPRAWIVLVLLGTSCAGRPDAASSTTGTGGGSPSAAPKRVMAAIMSEPQIVSWKLSAGDNVRAGLDTVEPLVHAGLSLQDDQGRLQPVLAGEVPSVENGLWRIAADGRMETTWRVRPNAAWHDGTPLTSADLVFSAAVQRDRELPAFRDARFRFVDSVEALDERSVLLRWSQPFIDADAMFGSDLLPKHLLERTYSEAKVGLIDLPYWSTEFVGTGPYRLRDFVRGSHLLLEANEQYVLGRPRIDAIEVKFIADSNTLVANIMAGAVELTLGRSISVEQGVLIRDRWRDGKIGVALVNLLRVFPQFVNPDPPVVLDVRFRRALLHAIDRQEMVDTLQAGLTPVAHSFLNPGVSPYRHIEERDVVRYDFDLRRTAQLLEVLGYARGADGMFRDAANQPLAVDVQVSASQEINVRSTFAVADYWQRSGVAARPVVEPTQMSGAERREYIAARPAFLLTRQESDVGGLPRLHGSETPLPENNFVGGNTARYMNSEFDALLDRLFTTVPRPERADVLRQIIHHISDQLIMLPLYYGAEPAAIGHRLVNVGVKPSGGTQAWNATEWDVK